MDAQTLSATTEPQLSPVTRKESGEEQKRAEGAARAQQEHKQPSPPPSPPDAAAPEPGAMHRQMPGETPSAMGGEDAAQQQQAPVEDEKQASPSAAAAAPMQPTEGGSEFPPPNDAGVKTEGAPSMAASQQLQQQAAAPSLPAPPLSQQQQQLASLHYHLLMQQQQQMQLQQLQAKGQTARMAHQQAQLPPGMTRSACCFCETMLQFPADVPEVQCPKCQGYLQPLRRMETQCTQCSTMLSYNFDAKEIKCPQCENVFKVQSPATATPPNSPTLTPQRLPVTPFAAGGILLTPQQIQQMQQVHMMHMLAQQQQQMQRQHMEQQQMEMQQQMHHISPPTTPASHSSGGKVKKERKKSVGSLASPHRRGKGEGADLPKGLKGPKRPLSARLRWCAEHRDEFKKMHQGKKTAEVTQALKEAYDQLPEETRKELEAKAQMEMESYKAAKANWDAMMNARQSELQAEKAEAHAAQLAAAGMGGMQLHEQAARPQMPIQQPANSHMEISQTEQEQQQQQQQQRELQHQHNMQMMQQHGLHHLQPPLSHILSDFSSHDPLQALHPEAHAPPPDAEASAEASGRSPLEEALNSGYLEMSSSDKPMQDPEAPGEERKVTEHAHSHSQ